LPRPDGRGDGGDLPDHLGPPAPVLRQGDRRGTSTPRHSQAGPSGEKIFGADEGTRVLAGGAPRPDLSPDPDLPDDTRLWAALQQAGGGTWGGRVYDVDAIAAALKRR
jgi:hypothetical protein